jgi:hypothetical protein
VKLPQERHFEPAKLTISNTGSEEKMEPTAGNLPT